MSATSTAVSVSTTRVQLGSGKDSRKQLLVYPDASTTVYIGGTNVTSTSGAALAPGDPPFDVYAAYLGDKSPAQSFYAITASGTATLRVTEIAF